MTLKKNHPDLASEFESVKFTFNKSNWEFSAITTDQLYGKANVIILADNILLMSPKILYSLGYHTDDCWTGGLQI